MPRGSLWGGADLHSSWGTSSRSGVGTRSKLADEHLKCIVAFIAAVISALTENKETRANVGRASGL